MKKISLLCFCYSCGIWAAPAATVLARWTFEVNPPPDAIDRAELGPVEADEGQGQAYGFHAAATADYSTPGGNGSANSLSSNSWRPGDYYEFRLATLQWEDIVVTWDQARTSTGPGAFNCEYSTDGVTYVAFTTGYTVPVNAAPQAWSSSVRQPLFGFSADLSGLAEVEHAAELRLRLRQMESGLLATGASRVDNFVVTAETAATAVPEPSAAALGAVAVAAWLLRRRR